MITVTSKGDFRNTYKFLERVTDIFGYSILDKYAKRGVEALREATPKDTGTTANSWYYEVVSDHETYARINFKNSNINDGFPIALLIQYGHGTRRGAYVQGIDYINPALRPIFDDITEDVWKEVTDL